MVSEPTGRNDHISFSQINSYRFCPYKYKLDYMSGERRFQRSVHLDFGSSVHFAMEKYLKDVSGNSINDTNFYQECFSNHFFELYNKNGDKYNKPCAAAEIIGDWIPQGKRVVSEAIKYIKSEYGDNFLVIGVEVPIHFMIDAENKTYFDGFVDCIIKDKDGNIRIVDWKTTVFWDAEKKSDKYLKYQLILYKSFLMESNSGIDYSKAKTEFVLLKRTSKEVCERLGVQSGSKKLDEARKYVDSTLKMINRRVFVKNYLSCRNCQYKNSSLCSGMGM